MSDNRPIGVFDSGVGGLTVLQALRDRLPEESTIYLGDLARCPYGIRTKQEVRKFAIELADRLVAEDVKLLVVACNTIMSTTYDELCDRYDIPVIGVIRPAVRDAVARSRRGNIGVVATDVTVASGAYVDAILEEAPGARVLQDSASWMVPMIERGPFTHARVAAELRPSLQQMVREGMDVLILGCTHFPLVRHVFEAELFAAGVAVVDSARPTAAQVADIVRELDMQTEVTPSHRLLVTGPPEAFAERAQAMFRVSPVIEHVDVTRTPLGTP